VVKFANFKNFKAGSHEFSICGGGDIYTQIDCFPVRTFDYKQFVFAVSF